jgi:hypothetical protein
MTLTHSMLMPLLQLFAENASVAVEGNQSCVRNYRLAFDLAKGDGNFGSANTREYLFPMHFAAELVDDNYCKIWVFEQVFVAKPPCKIFAMLNRTCGGRKLQSNSVPDWNSILHVKIKSPHETILMESQAEK